MELEGAKRSFSFLGSSGVVISKFVYNRHKGIAKWLRLQHPDVTQLYDIWHVIRSCIKKLVKASKTKGLEVLKEWTKGVRNHLYWCIQSTKAGFHQLVIAKWISILRHASNKHEGHGELFPKCAHGEDIQKRKWIKVGRQELLKTYM